MSKPNDAGQSPVILAPECPIIRVLLYPNCIEKESGKVARGSFIRRAPHPETGQPRDSAGLSVCLEERISVSKAVLDWPNCRGIVRLSAGGVREIECKPQLDVVQSNEEIRKESVHANIVNLPENKGLANMTPDEVMQMEHIATMLAKRSELVYSKNN